MKEIKMKIIFAFILLMSISSCGKEIEPAFPCHYNLDMTGDTSLFVSYSINKIGYRYYQKFDSSTFASESGLILGNQKVFNLYYHIQFDSIGWNGAMYTDNYPEIHPYVDFLIHDTVMYNKNSLSFFPLPSLSSKIRQNYNFTFPKTLRSPAELSSYDPLFFPGISIALFINKIEYSTERLVTYYNFSKDSLSKYLWNDSYFRILKSKNVCGNLKLVTGEFSTTVIVGYTSEFYKIENGRFRIIIR
jgi:hypothetical protein